MQWVEINGCSGIPGGPLSEGIRPPVPADNRKPVDGAKSALKTTFVDCVMAWGLDAVIAAVKCRKRLEQLCQNYLKLK